LPENSPRAPSGLRSVGDERPGIGGPPIGGNASRACLAWWSQPSAACTGAHHAARAAVWPWSGRAVSEPEASTRASRGLATRVGLAGMAEMGQKRRHDRGDLFIFFCFSLFSIFHSQINSNAVLNYKFIYSSRTPA
jgi:hypothetical protein